MPKVEKLDKPGSMVEKIQSLLLRPPSEMGTKIFSAAKSKAMLDRVLTRRDSNNSTTVSGAHSETVAGSTTTTGTLDTEWFTFGLAGADAVGFDLADGVVIRITLYYKRPANAKIVDQKKTPDSEFKYIWDKTQDRGALCVSCDIHAVYWYELHHPAVPKEVDDAMKNQRILKGMTAEEASIALGRPDHVATDNQGGSSFTTLTWDYPRGEYWSATLKNGEVTGYSHHEAR